ncbi:lysozyme inhibitor LprI family protein [Aurantibacter sp.]|uniref:lysozyme inhibitor LprI family protein n=1 Tax=Aurantibacter sp. TaxID=2807103 RepID=UPI0035C81243
MKYLIIVLFLSINFTSFSQTQSEMNKEASNAYKKADANLNNVYKQILAKYKTDTVFIDKLRKTQRIWITYRDAELEMKFPAENKQLEYGSVYPMCVSLFLKELIEERIQRLKVWIDGAEEGDICEGSMALKQELIEINPSRAYIEKDSTIWIPENIHSELKIFGYQDKNIESKKMILISVFTNDVENNPYNCEYGSYYHTQSMSDIVLKYLSTQEVFMEVAVLKKGKLLGKVYMDKKWFVFEE